MSDSMSSTPLTFDGVTLPMSEWATRLGIPYVTVRMRYTRGERDPAKLLRQPRGYLSATGTHVAEQPEHRSLLSELFGAATTKKLQDLAALTGETPLMIATKIVQKYADELHIKHCNHADE
jgi:hypothetical protein